MSEIKMVEATDGGVRSGLGALASPLPCRAKLMRLAWGAQGGAAPIALPADSARPAQAHGKCPDRFRHARRRKGRKADLMDGLP